jgi:glycosyltransferase involved in cell wall biosynthesis
VIKNQETQRILFLWPDRLRRDLGGPKIVIEVAEALMGLGWSTTLFDPWTLPDQKDTTTPWQDRCRDYLRQHAQEYDVVDYDHGHLPFPREEFPRQTLMVARSGLLSHHFLKIKIPDLYPLRDQLRRLLKGKAPHERYELNNRRAQLTCQEADLINVANQDDKKELIARGLPAEKVCVLPFGLSEARRELFSRFLSDIPPHPKVAFVGSFDGRKGAREFPEIVEGLVQKLPGIKVCLLGTKGRFRTMEEVQVFFPRCLHEHLEIVPEYPPTELPALLSSCSVGIFPSYIEGFPFGVLEMMAAAIPVIAYDAPGAPMMVPADLLVPRGDGLAMVAKVVWLMQDQQRLRQAREEARQRSTLFTWQKTAVDTSDLYLRARQALLNS